MIKERPLTHTELETFAARVNARARVLPVLGFAFIEGETHATYNALMLMPNGVDSVKQGKTEQQFCDFMLETFAESVAPNIEKLVIYGDAFAVGDELRTTDGLLSKQDPQFFSEGAVLVLGGNTFMNNDTWPQLESPHLTRAPLMPPNRVLIVDDGAVSVGITTATLCEHMAEPGKYSLRIGLHLSIDRSKVYIYSC